MTKVRLNRFIAESTGISRRKADELIRDGKVKVNGKIGLVGQTVLPQKDKITLEGKLLEKAKKCYVAFYKPAGCITTRFDPQNRKTIYDCLPKKYHHLDPAGRLDRESSGLLLMSNDGDFIHQLAHPGFEHKKVYRVKVDKPLTPDVLGKLESGIVLHPENRLAKQKVQEIKDRYTLVLILQTGLNRQIRRSFKALGYEVINLKRTAFAGITLNKLRPGQTRELKPYEIKSLRLQLQRNNNSRNGT